MGCAYSADLTAARAGLSRCETDRVGSTRRGERTDQYSGRSAGGVDP
jgi:hypothetical protein